MTIEIKINSFHGELEKHLKTVTYEAYKNNWMDIELNKGKYNVSLNFIKIAECNNCD